MSAYNDLAARLREVVGQMNTLDIAQLEEQSDFIESIKTYLKKHDSRSLEVLGQRLQEYSIIDLAELSTTVSNGSDPLSRTTEEEWASLVAPQRDHAYTNVIIASQIIEELTAKPPDRHLEEKAHLVHKYRTHFKQAWKPLDYEWNFIDSHSLPHNDTDILNSMGTSSAIARPDLRNSDSDEYSAYTISTAYLPDIESNFELSAISKHKSDAPAPLLDLQGDFSRSKAEEIFQAAKSLIRSDVQQFLDTFLPIWQNQGLWGNHKLELLRGSGNSHERLESAYRCLTCLGLRIADDPVRSRMASITLYREFHTTCIGLKAKGPSYKHTAQRGRGVASPVIDYTLRRIYKDFDRLSSKRQKELRADFHDSKRFGKRWQRLASSIGYGILLVCSKAVTAVIKKTTFTDAMLDALADTVRKHMSECWNVITELDQLAISLLSGEPMSSTLNLLSLQERISRYFNDLGSTAFPDSGFGSA